MITREEIEEVVNSDMTIKDFCELRGFSKVTFYNYMRKYGIKVSKNEKAKNKIKSSIGHRYNRWAILEYIDDTPTSNGMLKCRCDCGTKQDVRYYDLISGQTKGCNSCSSEERSKNCGQYERKLGKENWKFNGYEKLTGQHWSVIKSNAKVRNVEFNIEIKYAYGILENQKFKCALSGIDIELEFKNNRSWTATLDRIDPTKGYIEGNIQWLHKDVNKMKWDYNESTFIYYCGLISQNYNKIFYNEIMTYEERKRPGNWKGYKDIAGIYWWRMRDGAKKRNIGFELEIEDVWDLYIRQGRKCALSGIDIQFEYRHKDQTASVDRIDSKGPYSIDNIQIVHKHINEMKMNLKQEDFIRYCKLVTEKNSDSK